MLSFLGGPLCLSLGFIRLAVVERRQLLSGLLCRLLGRLLRLLWLLLVLGDLLLSQGAVTVRLVLVQLRKHRLDLGSALLQ